jgi:hypothetical protein
MIRERPVEVCLIAPRDFLLSETFETLAFCAGKAMLRVVARYEVIDVAALESTVFSAKCLLSHQTRNLSWFRTYLRLLKEER